MSKKGKTKNSRTFRSFEIHLFEFEYIQNDVIYNILLFIEGIRSKKKKTEYTIIRYDNRRGSSF